jgi:hypothetical protein
LKAKTAPEPEPSYAIIAEVTRGCERLAFHIAIYTAEQLLIDRHLFLGFASHDTKRGF